MRYRVGVDWDTLAAFDDEAAALTFIGRHFDSQLVRDELWLEVGDEGDAELIYGEELVGRLSAVHPTERTSAPR
jgi:hypothetical protein